MGSRSIVSITLFFSSLVLLLAGAVTYRANLVLDAATETLRHTHDTELALEHTLSVLRDAETGQRGYLLTRRAEYLAPYEAALAQIDTQLGELDALFADDPAARQALDELTALVRVKTDELERTIELERNGATADALAVVLTDAGRFAMDEIRAVTERMQRDEDRKLQA